MNNQLDEKLISDLVESSMSAQLIEKKISTVIASLKNELDEKNKKVEDIKNALKVNMAEKGVKKFENEIISITYVAPSIRKTIDSGRLKDEKPEIFEEYSKLSNVSDSVRIKIKETEFNDIQEN